MESPSPPIGKSRYAREEPPGFLERSGIQYYRKLAASRQADSAGMFGLEELPPEAVLQSHT